MYIGRHVKYTKLHRETLLPVLLTIYSSSFLLLSSLLRTNSAVAICSYSVASPQVSSRGKAREVGVCRQTTADCRIQLRSVLCVMQFRKQAY
jgi:hypothetical protein